ncbi:VIT family protein [Corynebacterium sp. 35RC1]|nr:VIT family protein [Corynebacterium sp. 35RC1]
MALAGTKEQGFEPHAQGMNSKLNWIRAGVLGANDGIVSVAALLIAVIAAGSDRGATLTAGMAALVAGAISMALGEYVSVSAQRDSERSLVELERFELEHYKEEEIHELAEILEKLGMEAETAARGAREIQNNDPLAAHLQLELGIDEEELTSPIAAAISSAISFTLGALLPLLAAVSAPADTKVFVVAACTLIALGCTGYLSAVLAKTPRARSSLRLVVGGTLGLILTYFAGSMFGV